MERQPLPGWLAYPLLIALAIAGTYVLTRAIGWGTPLSYIALIGAQVVYPLALTHYANGVARDAFNRFRPLLPPNTDSEAIVRELTTVPAGGTWIAAFVGAAIGGLSIAALGEQGYARFGGVASTAPYMAVVLMLTGLTFGAMSYRIFRQVRTVVRLHQEARNVDPLRPYPAHAFARLTAVLGLGLVVVTFAWSAIDIEQQIANPSFLLASVATVVLGGALFVAPLWGMHQRLVAERFRLLDEISERLERVTREIHARAAALDVRDADALNKLADALIAERDLVYRTSTWPWERGTASTFATALGAPIVLFLMTRLLDRFV